MKKDDPFDPVLFRLKLLFLELVKFPVFALKEIKVIRSQRLFNALIFVYPILAIVSIALVISGTTGLDVALGTTPQATLPIGVFFHDGNAAAQIKDELKDFDYLKIIEFESQKELLDAISSSRVRLGVEIIPPQNEYSFIETKFYYDNSNFIASSTIVGQLKTVIQNISFKKSGETLGLILSDINSIEGVLNGQSSKIQSILIELDDGRLEVEELRQNLQDINLDSVQSQLDNFSSFYAEGKAGIAQTLLDINALQEKVARHKTTVHGISEQSMFALDTANSALTSLRQAATDLNQSGQTAVAIQILAVHDSLELQVLELEEINAGLVQAETDLDDTSQKMSIAQRNLVLADARLDTANSSINDIAQNISQLQELIAQARVVLENSLESRELLRQDLVNAKNLLNGLGTRLSQLKNYSPEFLSNPVKVTIEPVYEFSRVTALVPFTIAFVLLLTCMLLASTSMINEEQWGILFRLKSSPTGFVTWLAGKMAGQTIVALFETMLIFAVAILFFGSPLPQKPLEVFVAITISAVCFVSVGIAITNFMKTVSNSIFTALLLIVPMVFLSGILVPIEFLPPLLDTFARLLPFTASIDLIQGTYLRQAGLLDLLPSILPLLGLTVLCTVMTYFYRKKKK